MPIYTRTGDTGETSLFGGKRVPKSASIIDAYGAIDELNSSLGVIGSILTVVDVQSFLRTIQADLFIIGSVLAGGDDTVSEILPHIKDMEKRIDVMDETLPALHKFILPGGSLLAAQVHMARSICRRAERKVVYVHTHEEEIVFEKSTIKGIIQYLNRLSDFLFVLARFCNFLEHKTEIIWEKEEKK